MAGGMESKLRAVRHDGLRHPPNLHKHNGEGSWYHVPKSGRSTRVGTSKDSVLGKAAIPLFTMKNVRGSPALISVLCTESNLINSGLCVAILRVSLPFAGTISNHVFKMKRLYIYKQSSLVRER